MMNITDAHHAFTDIWKLYFRYANRRPDPEEMKRLVQEVDVLSKRHPSKLSRDILMAVMGEIDRNIAELSERGRK